MAAVATHLSKWGRNVGTGLDMEAGLELEAGVELDAARQ
jgi:hypothetical protein